MTIEAILSVLLRYRPNISLSDAMAMAQELKALSAPSQPVTQATLIEWVRAYDARNGRGYVKNHRIQAIKALREAFVINDETPTVTLKEAKDAVDAYAGPVRYNR